MWGLLIAWAAGTYVLDVVAKPRRVAAEARLAAARRGKPLLNIGAGTPNSSLSNAVFGPQVVGDVNMDISASGEIACTPDTVCHGDILAIPYADKTFGAVLASHVVEHVGDPALALSELERVADEVFVIVPKWWAPHTWVHPGHKWYISQDLQTIKPLWR